MTERGARALSETRGQILETVSFVQPRRRQARRRLPEACPVTLRQSGFRCLNERELHRA
jgi:hypothetical protein